MRKTDNEATKTERELGRIKRKREIEGEREGERKKKKQLFTNLQF